VRGGEAGARRAGQPATSAVAGGCTVAANRPPQLSHVPAGAPRPACEGFSDTRYGFGADLAFFFAAGEGGVTSTTAV